MPAMFLARRTNFILNIVVAETFLSSSSQTAEIAQMKGLLER